MIFYVYKMVLQLFFTLYDKAQISQITSFKKLLNWFENESKQQFKSFKSNPAKVKQEWLGFLEQYSPECGDYHKTIAANSLLTMIRSGALSLNIKPELGHKVI